MDETTFVYFNFSYYKRKEEISKKKYFFKNNIDKNRSVQLHYLNCEGVFEYRIALTKY